MSQDNSREIAVIRHFGLSETSDTNRSNEYRADAKLTVGNKVVRIELKSKPELKYRKGKLVRKRDVSTARGFSPHKANEWKTKADLFIFSEYTGNEFVDEFNEHYVLKYSDLSEFINQKVIKPFNEGRPPSARSDGYYGYGEFEKKVLPLLEGSFSEKDIKRLKHTIYVGTSLNDPKIPWDYIRKNGTLVNNRADLVSYVNDNL
tara:strand:+ start:161 stop:772 length:612 start_codon:yes stop_codon:yes gene_type:complete